MSRHYIARFSLLLFPVLLSACSSSMPSSTSTNTPAPTTVAENTQINQDRQPHQSSTTASAYQEYSAETLSATQDKQRVLFFYASWCPTCIAAEKDIKANLDQLPEDVVIVRVNYADSETSEEEKALAQQYGITYQHTFVLIDQAGNEIAKWNGGQTQDIVDRLN